MMLEKRKRHTPDDWKTSLFDKHPQLKTDKRIIRITFITGLITGLILATIINELINYSGNTLLSM